MEGYKRDITVELSTIYNSFCFNYYIHSSSAMQTFISKPVDEPDLRNPHKTTLADFQAAIRFDDERFQKMKVNVFTADYQLHYDTDLNVQKRLQNLAKKYLDINMLLEDQYPSGQWQRLMQEVGSLLCTQLHANIQIFTQATAIEPLFTTMFEGAWPVSAYLNRYLHSRLSNSGRSAKRKHGRQSGRAIHEHAAKRSVRLARLADTSASDDDLAPANPFRHSSHVHLPPTALENENTSPVSSESASDEENTRPHLPSPAVSSPDPSAPVRHFLLRVGRDLEVLLPVFVKKGIKDEATLSAFKVMPNEDRRAFLMSMRELDDFQVFRLQAPVEN
jgi:hypothetical protein